MLNLNLNLNPVGEVKKESFSNFTDLKELNLRLQHIRSIDLDAFDNLKELEKLNLSHNLIKGIKKQLFSKLIHLKELDLSFNEIAEIDLNVFDNLNELKKLDLSDNSIQKIKTPLFSNLTQLEELDLSFNKIASIDFDAFHNLRELKKLNLSENSIKEVKREIFSNLTHLKELNLSFNKIIFVDLDSFHNLTELESLNLSRNSMEEVKNIFSNLIHLKVLNLGFNSIISIDLNVFDNLKELESLYLTNNLLKNRVKKELIAILVPKIRVQFFGLSVEINKQNENKLEEDKQSEFELVICLYCSFKNEKSTINCIICGQTISEVEFLNSSDLQTNKTVRPTIEYTSQGYVPNADNIFSETMFNESSNFQNTNQNFSTIPEKIKNKKGKKVNLRFDQKFNSEEIIENKIKLKQNLLNFQSFLVDTKTTSNFKKDSSRLSRYLSQEPTLAFNNPKEEKMKIITIKNKFEKKWVRILVLNKKDLETNDYVIDSIDNLVNQFKSPKNPTPKFTPKSNKYMKISSLEQFFQMKEDTFMVQEDDVEHFAELKDNEVTVLISYFNNLLLIKKFNLNEKVKTLKCKISYKLRILPRDQCLIFNGEILKNGKSLKDYYYITMNSKIILKLTTKEEVLWLAELKDEFNLGKQINELGGEVNSNLIDLLVPVGAVNQNTNFEIKQSFKYFEIPFEIRKLSPLFEIMPHSLKLNKPITIRMKDFSGQNEKVFLFKQENSENDRALVKWTVHFPSRHENGFIEFELNSFSFLFLGYIHIGIKVDESELISEEDFNKRLKPYQYIHPGLNYRISCDFVPCLGFVELKIVNRGYGTFDPIEDLGFNDENNMLACPICNQPISKTTSIKSIILFQAQAVIDYNLADKEANAETVTHKKSFLNVEGNTFSIFGNEEITQNYGFIKINVNKSCNPHQNILAGVLQETSKNLKYKNELCGFIKKNSNFKYNIITIKPADFIIKQMSISPIQLTVLSSVFEYKPPQVTDNHPKITFDFERDDEYGDIPDVGLLSFSQADICLFTQDNDDNDRILNKWNVHFPLRCDSKNIFFEIKSYHNAFLGKISIEIENLKQGLNYLLKCEAEDCSNMFIFNRVINDSLVEPVKDLSLIICPTCKDGIEHFSSIISFILKQSKGNINFKSKNDRNQKRNVPFDLNENQLLFFGNNTYKGLSINIWNKIET